MRCVRRAALLATDPKAYLWPLAFCAALAGCQNRPADPVPAEPDNRAAVRLLQVINDEAQRCWRGDRDFRPYKVMPELDTRYGKPRILLVPAEAPQGLPQLVIEAQGTPARLESYGPLAGEAISGRIRADLARWQAGGKGCSA